MKKAFTFFMLFFILWCVKAQTQEITVTGTVISADDNVTLPGVTVLVKGTVIGTTTDIDGNYSLSQVPSGGTLVFSFVGMVSQKIPVEGRTTIDIVLETESFGLDEVVVIGYGTVKKKDVTGSVSVVDSKTIDKLRPVKAEQALQGTVSGINVTQQSGAPGANLDIRIRGISTNGDPSPVVIIDGFIGDLNTINPGDIESMTVLKDAQAAIYGTVGANGIILITTKSGKKNTPTSVTINSSFGIQETTRKLPVLNATEYGVLLNESYAANGEDLPFPDVSQLGIGTDWQDQLFQTAPIFDNSLSVSGGSNKVVYTLSASDLRQDGIIGGDKTGYNRTIGRISMGADLANWLNFSSAIQYSYIQRQSINDFGLGSVLFNAVNMPATVPVYDEGGSYFLAPDNVGIEIINPLQQIADTYNDYNVGKLTGNASLEAKFAQHFTATARIGFNTANSKYKSFSKEVYYGEGKVFNNNRSRVYQEKENHNDYSFDAFITYDNTFNEAHHVTGTIGTTIFKTWGNNLNASGFDIPYNSWEFADIVISDGLSSALTNGSWVYDQRRLSYFGRAQYDYKGKYLLSAMIRRDASTKFGPDNAVAWFPSATAGWIISDENFMSGAKKINLLKFRMSYGILGSDKIDSYKYISQLNGEGVYVIDGMLNYGKAIGPLPNPSVKWEESEQFDVGFDLKFLEDRIDIAADYFNKTTRDLLIPNIPVSGIFGTSAPGAAPPTINAGTVRNQGFEFAIGYRGTTKKDFVYRFNYNFTYLDNEVLKVDNGTGFYPGGGFSVGQTWPARMEVGLPIGYYYGYETDGIFQTQEEVDAHPSQIALGAEASPGDIRFKDLNDDGVIDVNDKTYIGDPIPKFLMGLNITLQFKGFDFITYFYASIGNDVVRNYERTLSDVNKLTYTMNRWTGPGTSNEVPRVTTAATSNNVFSDYYVEDGSYLRIQRVQLGYTIPEKATKKIGIKEIRLFFAVSNLYTFTKYMGYDPAAYKGYDPVEQTGSPIGAGFDSGFYPAARTYTFGLNLNI